MAEALCQGRSEAEAKRTLDMEMPSRQFPQREDGAVLLQLMSYDKILFQDLEVLQQKFLLETDRA
jgi:hypothetical protein